jgi:hypothetical protein
MQHKSFLPRRGLLLLPINGQGVIAFACKNDGGQPEIMEPVSERLRDKPSVHGQRHLRDINTLTMKFSFQT